MSLRTKYLLSRNGHVRGPGRLFHSPRPEDGPDGRMNHFHTLFLIFRIKGSFSAFYLDMNKYVTKIINRLFLNFIRFDDQNFCL